MKVFVATSMIGVFAFDEGGNLIHYKLFPQVAEKIAEKIAKSRKGELLPEEAQILEEISGSGFKQLVWDKKLDVPGYECLFEQENLAKALLQRDMRKLALELKFADSDAELNSIMSRVNILLTKEQLRKPKKDRMLMSAIGVVDELDRVSNTLSERLREWYGLHFPEADRLIQSNEQLVRIIHEQGGRETISDKHLEKYVEKSAGMPFSDEDIGVIKEYAGEILKIFKARDSVSDYIKKLAKEAVPNLSAVAGHLITARLLMHAGGLEKLARMPSSTIQLLGAEKALFRHLRGEGKAPKFGVIFAHPLIQKASRDEKGKAARILAAKLTMAARADFYTGKDISEKLLTDMKSKAKENRKRAGDEKKEERPSAQAPVPQQARTPGDRESPRQPFSSRPRQWSRPQRQSSWSARPPSGRRSNRKERQQAHR